jgi:hypothetical protein
LSHDDNSFSSSKYFAEEMRKRTNDEQTKMFLHGNLEVAEDLMDNGLEAFV